MDQSSYLLDETYSRLNFKQLSRCAGPQVLQLEDVRRQVVGDGGARGISGGQRKRVNLGLELVAAPALLLLGAPSVFGTAGVFRMRFVALLTVVQMQLICA